MTTQEIQVVQKQAESVLEQAENQIVKTQDDADAVNNALIRITAGLNEAEKKRKRLTAPLLKAKNTIDTECKTAVEPYKKAKIILSNKLMAYRRIQQEKENEAIRKQEEEQRKVDEAAQKRENKNRKISVALGGDGDVKPVEAEQIEAPVPFKAQDTTKVRKNVVFEITDRDKIPKKFWDINETRIRKAIFAAERDDDNMPKIEIPGVKIELEESPIFA